jgi:hypothetical protein
VLLGDRKISYNFYLTFTAKEHTVHSGIREGACSANPDRSGLGSGSNFYNEIISTVTLSKPFINFGKVRWKSGFQDVGGEKI